MDAAAAARPPLAPAPAAAAGTHHQPPRPAAQQQEQPSGSPTHRIKQLEVCGHSGAGLHVCVEHTVDEETGAELAAESPLTGPAAALSRLMNKIPLSKRTRGIIMLNLLVLLVATNWVRGWMWVLGCRGARLWVDLLVPRPPCPGGSRPLSRVLQLP